MCTIQCYGPGAVLPPAPTFAKPTVTERLPGAPVPVWFRLRRDREGSCGPFRTSWSTMAGFMSWLGTAVSCKLIRFRDLKTILVCPSPTSSRRSRGGSIASFHAHKSEASFAAAPVARWIRTGAPVKRPSTAERPQNPFQPTDCVV